MKRYCSALVVFLVAIVSALGSVDASAQNEVGAKSVGLRGGFTSRNTTATAGLYFSYRFTEHFRFAPKMDYAFRHHDVDAFSFNFDSEYPISLDQSTGRVNFYPIAGLNFSTATVHYPGGNTAPLDDESDDSSQRINRFGINLGAGIEFFATPTLRLSFESKCLLIKQFTGAWLTASIGYVF